MDNQFQLRIAYGSGPLEEFNVCWDTVITMQEAYQSTGTDIPIPPQRSGLDYINSFCCARSSNNKTTSPTISSLGATSVSAIDQPSAGSDP